MSRPPPAGDAQPGPPPRDGPYAVDPAGRPQTDTHRRPAWRLRGVLRAAARLIDDLSPLDRLMLGYTGTVAGIALAFGRRQKRYRRLAAAHLGVAAGIAGLGAVHRATRSGAVGFVRQTYPLLLLGPMHFWSGELARVVCPRFLDREVIRWDRRVFGRDWYVVLPRRFNSRISREVMNGAYFAFYPMIAGLALSTWLWRRPRMGETVYTLSLCMYGHFLFFMLVPVIGPTHLRRKLFPPPRGLFETVVWNAIENGDNDGGAFPSSHVAGAVVITALGRRLFGRKTGRALGALTGALTVSTVYISMHYPIDVVAGGLTGWAAFRAGPGLYRRARRRAEQRDRGRAERERGEASAHRGPRFVARRASRDGPPPATFIPPDPS